MDYLEYQMFKGGIETVWYTCLFFLFLTIIIDIVLYLRKGKDDETKGH